MTGRPVRAARGRCDGSMRRRISTTTTMISTMAVPARNPGLTQNEPGSSPSCS
jgi:hypothetical protein